MIRARCNICERLDRSVGACPLPHTPPRAHTSQAEPLHCTLTGGLTNQENQVENCLAIAALAGRALVAPQPRIWPKSTVATRQAGASPFWQLWNRSHFVDCARQRYGVRIVGERVSPLAPVMHELQMSSTTSPLMWRLYAMPNSSTSTRRSAVIKCPLCRTVARSEIEAAEAEWG